MLTKVEVVHKWTNAVLLTFGVENADASPIQIRNVTGLEPVKATINTAPYSVIGGESYLGSFVGKRNIVFTLGLNPNWVDQTPESLRTLLYEHLMPSKEVRLMFHLDTMAEPLLAAGYVENLEPNLFTKDPEIQLSVICPDPYFRKMVLREFTGIITSPGTDIEIDYEGTADTGIIVSVKPTVAVPSQTGEILVRVQTQDQPYASVMVFTSVLVDATHTFELVTIPGYKSVLSGSDNVFNQLVMPTQWLMLEPGINIFQVSAGDPGQEWTLQYQPMYGGL